MTDNEKNEVALFRYGIISDLVVGNIDTKSKKSFFRDASSKERYYNGKQIRISKGTIERWFYNYQKYGFDGLKPRNRSDCGRIRKIDGEIEGIINHYISEHPRMPASQIYNELLANHYITYDEVSLSTITRYVMKQKKNKGVITHSEMKRYEAGHINEIWACDTTYSFKLTVKGEKKRLYIIAIIDDASRLIVGVDVFFNDNYVNFMSVLKIAVKKYGKPKILNLDNGAPYKNNQINLLSARIGISAHHCAPYSGWQKGKIERWFRTMKDHFMASFHLTTNTTIDEFRDELLKYTNEYNNTIHSSLNNISPLTRFFDSGEEIKRLSDDEIEKGFLLEIERKASIDCVIQIDNKEFEVPIKYSKKNIKIRYSSDYKTCYVVNPDSSLERIELLDKVANSMIKRKQPKFNTEE